MRFYVTSVLSAVALAALAILFARYAQGHCFDFPDGRRCSTSAYLSIGGSVLAALGVAAVAGRVALSAFRHR